MRPARWEAAGDGCGARCRGQAAGILAERPGGPQQHGNAPQHQIAPFQPKRPGATPTGPRGPYSPKSSANAQKPWIWPTIR